MRHTGFEPVVFTRWVLDFKSKAFRQFRQCRKIKERKLRKLITKLIVFLIIRTFVRVPINVL